MKEIKKTLKESKSLSKVRTILAIERNTLSYIRTGFACFIFGIGLIKLFPESLNTIYVGIGSIGLGFGFIFTGILNQKIRKNKINEIS